MSEGGSEGEGGAGDCSSGGGCLAFDISVIFIHVLCCVVRLDV